MLSYPKNEAAKLTPNYMPLRLVCHQISNIEFKQSIERML